MKRSRLTVLPLVLLAFAGVALAQTSVPQQLSYEGWLSDLSVTVVNGLYSATLGTTAGDALPPPESSAGHLPRRPLA